MRRNQYGKAVLKVYESRDEMGRQAARDVAECLRRMLTDREEVNVVFAAAPSQKEMLAALIVEPDIAWSRVNAFHMDEYLGLPVGNQRSFSGFLINAIFGKLPFKTINMMNGEMGAQEECARYAALLQRNPPDLVCMGIGENGHIAFNDPPVANFKDPVLVKVVMLEDACRRQQVNDGCFAALADVPIAAITMTIPALFQAKDIFCVVPGERKAWALDAAMTGPVDESCPASILRKHDGVRIYADAASGVRL
jgi:glucosamine-6-phosphate deaminase